MFSSIARGIVQATTALLNFITPTTKLSESLEKERFALFKTEAELDRLDVKMQDTTLSEEDLEKAQLDRVKVIDELKLKYPKYLEDIDAETTSTEDLKKAIDQVNESLINKIIIQEKEEEILEQAEDTAARRLKLDEKQQAAQNYALKLKQELSDLNIKIKATSPNEILKELNEIELEQNRLRLEGNGQNKLKIGQIAELIDKQNNLKSRIKAVNDAEENYNNEQSITNKLTEEKDALMKRLNITTDDNTDKTDNNTDSINENSDAVEKVDKKTRDLILLKQQELKAIQNTEAKTREEIAARNDKVKAIQAEIKELQNLSLKKLDIERLDTESLPKLEKREAQKIEVRTGTEDQVDRYVRKVESDFGTYLAGEEEKKRLERLKTADTALRIAEHSTFAIQSLGDAAFAHRMKNLKEGSKEQLKAAKQQFNFNKALQLGMAVIDGGKAITASLAQSPLSIGPIPNPAGIASLAFASITSAAQIAMIAAQKYEAPKKSVASVSSPSIGGGGANTSPTQPPSFNVVGQSGFNQVAGALGQQAPVQAFVVSGDVTTAQQLQNNTITQATF